MRKRSLGHLSGEQEKISGGKKRRRIALTETSAHGPSWECEDITVRPSGPQEKREVGSDDRKCVERRRQQEPHTVIA